MRRKADLAVIVLVGMILAALAGAACTTDTPTGIEATDGDYCDKVVVTWNAVDDATLYQVYFATEGLGMITPLDTTTSASYQHTTASSTRTHYYSVAAYTDACGWSPLSTSDSGHVRFAPSAPADLTAVDDVSCGNVELKWSSVEGATKYRIRRATSLEGPYSTLGISFSAAFVDTNAIPGEELFYKVTAWNDCEWGPYSEPVCRSRGAVLPLPSNVNASDGTYCDRVAITWDEVVGATSYEVYRLCPDYTAYPEMSQPIAELLGTTASTSFDDTSAYPGEQGSLGCAYVILASNGCGTLDLDDALNSPEWIFLPFDHGYRAALPQPTGVSASDGMYCDKVTVSWDAVTGATSYNVYRTGRDNPLEYTLIGATASTSFDDTGTQSSLLAIQEYMYFVQAVNSCTESMIIGGNAGVLPPFDNGSLAIIPPYAPTYVDASDGTYSDRVEINWGPVSEATSYEVYRAPADEEGMIAFPFELLGTTGSTRYSDTNPLQWMPAAYLVVIPSSCKITKITYEALMMYGMDLMMPWDSGYALPAAPANPKAMDLEDQQVYELTWQAVPHASELGLAYVIYWVNQNTGEVATLATTKDSWFQDQNYIAGEGRCYQVAAYKEEWGILGLLSNPFCTELPDSPPLGISGTPPDGTQGPSTESPGSSGEPSSVAVESGQALEIRGLTESSQILRRSWEDVAGPSNELDEPPVVGELPVSTIYEVGEIVDGCCLVVDPEGEPVNTESVEVLLYAVTDLGEEFDSRAFLDVIPVSFDSEEEAYCFGIETGELPPGYYDLKLRVWRSSSESGWIRFQLIEAQE